MHTHDALAVLELPLSLNTPLTQVPAFALTTTTIL